MAEETPLPGTVPFTDLPVPPLPGEGIEMTPEEKARLRLDIYTEIQIAKEKGMSPEVQKALAEWAKAADANKDKIEIKQTVLSSKTLGIQLLTAFGELEQKVNELSALIEKFRGPVTNGWGNVLKLEELTK